MREIIIEVPDSFGQELKSEKVNSEIKGELVRCKDCKHYDGNGTCMKNGLAFLRNDWFCADGERKEGR